MLISHVRLKNWRNFRELVVPLRETTYIIGPNASGKILVSTHSEALLSNPGIDARSVILLSPGSEGTTGRTVPRT